MSNPADKAEHSGYAPKSTRYTNQQNNPGAAEGELARMGARPSSDRDMSNLRRSLEPEILAFRPVPWRPGWLASTVGLIIAVSLGAAIGIYLTDGPTWRKLIGFGTTTTETRSRPDAPTPSAQVSSPVPGLSIASMPPQPSTAAPPTAGLPIASAAPQPPSAAPPPGGLPFASAAPQPPNAAPPPGGLPFASAAPQPPSAAPPTAGLPIASAAAQPTNATPARVATVEAPSAGPSIRGVTDTEIRFGISAPFTGAAKELGNQMRLGINAAFNLANDAGGIGGRQAKLVVADDG